MKGHERWSSLVVTFWIGSYDVVVPVLRESLHYDRLTGRLYTSEEALLSARRAVRDFVSFLFSYLPGFCFGLSELKRACVITDDDYDCGCWFCSLHWIFRHVFVLFAGRGFSLWMGGRGEFV